MPGAIIRPMCVHVWRNPGLGHNVTLLNPAALAPVYPWARSPPVVVASLLLPLEASAQAVGCHVQVLEPGREPDPRLASG